MSGWLPPVIATSSGVSIVFIFLLYFAMRPDKVEQWSGLIARFLSTLGGAFRWLRKNSVKLDLQGNVNEFVRELKKLTPALETDRLTIRWVDPNTARKGFLENGQAVLRLRDTDSEEDNFVHGAYAFVSTCLLFRAKRHLSSTQKESLDLYVSGELVRRQKPASVVDRFVEIYLHPKLSESKRQSYYGKFSQIDEHGLLYPVFIQELDFVGRKVFGTGQKSALVKDFDSLIDFLEKTANRNVGDEIDLEFEGSHSRLAIMIIGKPSKIQNRQVYVHFLQRMASTKRIDGVYAIGLEQNREHIDAIINQVSDLYSVWQKGSCAATIGQGKSERRIVQYYAVLRRKNEEIVHVS